MFDKEQRYSKELERCLANIQRTKELIEFHRNMLKTYENKANVLRAKLDEAKMSSLCEIINKSGYDIDKLREAVQQGDFSSVTRDIPEDAEPDVQPTVLEETTKELASDNIKTEAYYDKNTVNERKDEE